MTPGPRHWKEARRLQARRLKPRGWSQRQIAEALGVSEGAARQWMTRARDGGADARRHRPPPGAPARLTHAPLARLPALLQQGPEAWGFRGALWPRGRIAAVVRTEVGVSSHPAHVSRLCQAIRWSPQKPARRARPRDEAASAHGRAEPWPALHKGRRRSSKPSCS
jgi:transposase